jgi:DNA-directed RNA polymerase specialized sigma24 family protein
MECLQGMSRAEVARCLRLRSWDVADLSMRGMRRLQRRTAAEQGPSRTSVDAGNAPVDRPPAGEIDAETAARFRARPDIMAALTERQRQAVGLRLFDGLSLSQVGARMGVSPQSVRQFILVAMKRLDAGVVEHEHNPGPPASEHVLRILNNPELLAGLSPRHREAIVLRYREGLNVEDTAQRMGTTYRAVTAMVCKVRDHERTRLAALESQAVAA